MWTYFECIQFFPLIQYRKSNSEIDLEIQYQIIDLYQQMESNLQNNSTAYSESMHQENMEMKQPNAHKPIPQPQEPLYTFLTAQVQFLQNQFNQLGAFISENTAAQNEVRSALNENLAAQNEVRSVLNAHLVVQNEFRSALNDNLAAQNEVRSVLNAHLVVQNEVRSALSENTAAQNEFRSALNAYLVAQNELNQYVLRQKNKSQMKAYKFNTSSRKNKYSSHSKYSPSISARSQLKNIPFEQVYQSPYSKRLYIPKDISPSHNSIDSTSGFQLPPVKGKKGHSNTKKVKLEKGFIEQQPKQKSQIKQKSVNPKVSARLDKKW